MDPDNKSNQEDEGSSTRGRLHAGWQLFMLALCVFVLGLMACESFLPLDDATKEILTYLDHGICLIFLFDFFCSLFSAPSKLQYLKWGWIDLVSAIPAVDFLRWGRIARILRVLRLLRGVKSTKILVGFLLSRRAENGFLAATLIAIILMAFSSIAVLQFEQSAEGGNIHSAEDAIWWAFVTMTTVGYGDTYPVTFEGRLVAAVLMSAGVGLFGTLTGLIASGFLESHEKDQDTELAQIQAELQSLRRLLEQHLEAQSSNEDSVES